MQTFQFKQFCIFQDNTVFKVGTDSCILGAWAPLPFLNGRCADFGTGTGLLALMLAQRSNFIIDAYEKSEDASIIAQHNIAISPWHNRIVVQNVDYFSLAGQNLSYDCIIANPPYFIDALPNPIQSKTQARHFNTKQTSLFVHSVASNLAPDGVFFTVLPVDTAKKLIPIFQTYNLHLFTSLNVRSTVHKNIHLQCLGFSASRRTPETAELIIYDPHAPLRSATYAQLLEAFYL